MNIQFKENILLKIIGLILILLGLTSFFVSAAIYNNFPLTLLSVLISFIGAFFLVASIPTNIKEKHKHSQISGFDDEIEHFQKIFSKDKK